MTRPSFRSKKTVLITLITLALSSARLFTNTNLKAQSYPSTTAIKTLVTVENPHEVAQKNYTLVPVRTPGKNTAKHPVKYPTKLLLAKNHPELFDEHKFEQIYIKWSKKLESEFREILSSEKLTLDQNGELLKAHIQAEAQAYFTENKTQLDPRFALSAKTEQEIRDWLKQYGVTTQYEPDLLLFELKKITKPNLFHRFKNFFKSNYEIAKLITDNANGKEAFTLSKITKDGQCQHLMGITTLSKLQVQHNYLYSNMLNCIVGHEGVHMLYYDNLYTAIYANNRKLNNFQEKRADILAILSCPCPLNSAVYWFDETYKDGLYSHRASPTWLELIYEIASCYQPEALVTIQKNKLNIPCSLLVHDIKPLIRINNKP